MGRCMNETGHVYNEPVCELGVSNWASIKMSGYCSVFIMGYIGEVSLESCQDSMKG